LIINALKKIEI